MDEDNKLDVNREEIPQFLAKRFWSDYLDVLKHYGNAEKIEITEHLITIFQLASAFIKTGNDKFEELIELYEDDLLTKYRSRLVAYFKKGFAKYALFDVALPKGEPETSIPAGHLLSDEDKENFLRSSLDALFEARKLLYLSDRGDVQPVITIKETKIMPDQPDKEMTRARQLLAIHYFLKASLGIEARDNNTASGVARFIHLITGTKFTSVQNSDIYKKYLRMPNYKTDKKLIEDLKYIRPYFVDLGLQSAIAMIDEEMRLAINELPLAERKKYKN